MTEREQPESQRTIGQQLLYDVTEAAWALEPGASSERTASIFAEVAAHLLDGTMERIAELEAQLEAVGAGGVEPLRKRCLHQISEPQAQPVVAAPWQPIATAPEGNPVVVFWLDAEDVEHPERHEFDYLEDGVWQKHDDNYQHFCAAAPPGSCGPRELPPYTHWMPLTSPQDGATTPQPAAQALYSVRVFWQQHTQAYALSMTMAELHNDVELVIRAARGAAQAAPRNGALAAPAQPVTWPRNAAEVREFMDAHCQREERANDDSSPSDDDLYALTADNFLSAVNSWEAEQPAPARGAGIIAQAVPAPGVEAVSEREFKQFLSDVLTAAGLVTHGKKCKDLGRRLGEMSMRLLTAPKTAAPTQAGEYPEQPTLQKGNHD